MNLKLHFHWRTRSDSMMQLVDRGSWGPWLDFDNFSLNLELIQKFNSHKTNLNAFDSYHNHVVDRCVSAGAQVEE